MAFDPVLAARVRAALGDAGEVVEKRMMGGICFMLDGHMCCGVNGSDLMIRTGPERHAELVSRPHARPMDFTGRPLKGFVWVAGEGLPTPGSLDDWIDLAVRFVRTLPARGPTPRSGGRPG